MVKSIVENGNLPKWANTIILGALAFLLVLYINNSQAQDSRQDNDIKSCEKGISSNAADVRLLKQGVESEVKRINEKLCGLKDAQEEMADQVSDNSKKIDRMTFLLEQMAERQGIK